MALSSEAKKSTIVAKPKPTVTLKHLAAASAEEHQMTKRASEAFLGDLVGMITKHLKKGEESALRASESYRSESVQLVRGVILQPAKRCKSKQVRKSHSGQPRI